METMKLSETGKNLIKRLEGLRLTAYQDSVGCWTIGYGHTVGVHAGMTITNAQADAFFDKESDEFAAKVNKLIKVPVTQNQFDAMVSLAYNIGIDAFGKSTLLSLVNQNRFIEVPAQFMRWNKAGGQVIKGLTTRRKLEAEYFRS